MGASYHRGSSEQCVQTQPDLIAAVERLFGPLTWDLAANQDNTQCGDRYFGPGSPHGEDSFQVDWLDYIHGNVMWLNPPYSNITPWAERCATFVRAGGQSRILLLIPASISTNYYRDFIYPYSMTLALNGRLQFVGYEDAYPKDMMLCVYGQGLGKQFDVWDWRRP